MLRELTILNTGESINKRIRLPEMENIGIGASRTIWEGNMTEFTRTIHTARIINRLKKNIGIENPTKREGTREQGMLKN